jgi:dihydrolipoamide dehydrogenase
VLVAVGRRPNGRVVGADAAGVFVDERGFIPVDKQQRTNVAHIFAIGDVVGQPMLAHKPPTKARSPPRTPPGHTSYFDATVIPSVAYTDPESPGSESPRTKPKPPGSSTARACSPGPRRAAPCPWAATRA